MTRLENRSLALAALALALAPSPGCKGRHSHDDGGTHGAENDLPGQSVTLWTQRTELFMEHPPLIAGQEVAFAAHVTALPSFKATTEGAIVLTLTMEDGHALSGRVDRASSPGIFRPKLLPDRAGKCQLSMKVEGPRPDEFRVGPCEVFADAKAARKALGAEEETAGRIPFLKEQQWTTEFATMPVEDRDLQSSVRANGDIRPVAGKEARLAAAASGWVVLANPVPVLGMPVKKGQVLATLNPRLGSGTDRASLEAEAESAQAELTAAEAQRSRAERLFTEQAIPEKNLEEARARASVARARLGAARGRFDQFSAGAAGFGGTARGAYQVRSPIDGTLVSIEVASGETIEEGKLLFHVIDLGRVWLQAQVFEPDIPKVEGARAAWFTIEGYDAPFVVDEHNGKLVAIGRVIDPRSRTVPVIFDVDNTDGRLRIGQFAKVSIATGGLVRGVAVPESALVDESGKPTAFVQAEGEAFERRQLTVGLKDRGWVQVLDGLRIGERVVTRGAYEIKLSAASGIIPAHGHAH